MRQERKKLGENQGVQVAAFPQYSMLSCSTGALVLVLLLIQDWGFWRTALLFFVGGVSGNLLSAVADPCNITVGSSGAMYALMGALIPYCVGE